MSEQTNEQSRKKYRINEVGEPMTEFKAVAEMEYIRSNDLCSLVASVFHTAFADFYGCLFEAQNGVPSLTLYFDHGKHEGSDLPCACEIASAATAKGNDVISRARTLDSLMKDGDRYYLTEDGKDVIADLLLRNVIDRNGKVNWKTVVADCQDTTTVNMWAQQAPIYTKVSMIDVARVARLVYGHKTMKDDNDTYDYGVTILTPLDIPNPFAMQAPNATHNYLLEIKRVPKKIIDEVSRQIGIIQGSSIITG